MNDKKLVVFCGILKLLDAENIIASSFVLNNEKSHHFEFFMMLLNKGF